MISPGKSWFYSLLYFSFLSHILSLSLSPPTHPPPPLIALQLDSLPVFQSASEKNVLATLTLLHHRRVVHWKSLERKRQKICQEKKRKKTLDRLYHAHIYTGRPRHLHNAEKGMLFKEALSVYGKDSFLFIFNQRKWSRHPLHLPHPFTWASCLCFYLKITL